ncbi:MAG: glycosyltransferase family 4 protein [Vulcanimicrobiaceae bacterium]
MTTLPQHAVLLSFEGPDPYAMVGGLGVRVTELAAALAEAGVQTTLLFVGDPKRPALERPAANLEYRRWCQWLSVHHPGNVYDGEHQKIADYRQSAPKFVCDEIVAPAVARGERVLVLAEEWHTAPATIELARRLRERGLREATTVVWNANNTYGFEMIDWPALRSAATITTVSRYMKFELAHFDIGSLVIPNGIPARLLAGPDSNLVAALERACAHRPMFVKIGRFSPDKRWLPAIDAFVQLRESFPQATLIARGGREPYADEVFARARRYGLEVGEVSAPAGDRAALIDALAASTAPIIHIKSFIDDALLYALYATADAVLANSGKEPFGLVGLEVMAAGGLAVCGSTGEEYAEPFVNAIVCDTSDGRELATYLTETLSDSASTRAMRENGRATARRYLWPTIVRILARKLAYIDGAGTAAGAHALL